MTGDWSMPAWAALVLGVLLALLVLLVVAVVGSSAAARRRDAADRAATERLRADVAALRAQVEALQDRGVRPASPLDEPEYVITHLGAEPAAVEPEVTEPADPVTPPLFADLVLREGAVQAASFAAGLRRALAPEMRNRIRFEMGREVKRARRHRRADQREARREFEARRRTEGRAESPAT